jgi:hypothetical protein
MPVNYPPIPTLVRIDTADVKIVLHRAAVRLTNITELRLTNTADNKVTGHIFIYDGVTHYYFSPKGFTIMPCEQAREDLIVLRSGWELEIEVDTANAVDVYLLYQDSK